MPRNLFRGCHTNRVTCCCSSLTRCYLAFYPEQQWPVAWRRAYPWRRGGSGFEMDILAGIVGQALRMIGFWWVSGMRETLTSAAQQEQAGA